MRVYEFNSDECMDQHTHTNVRINTHTNVQINTHTNSFYLLPGKIKVLCVLVSNKQMLGPYYKHNVKNGCAGVQ